MATQPDDVEILVHINAPSRVADDATYRQLAEAYLDFEPSRRTALPCLNAEQLQDIEEPDSKRSCCGSEDDVQNPVVTSSSQSYATPAPAPVFLDSQDLSFQSALDNRESPRLGDTTVGITLDIDVSQNHDNATGTQQSWQAPPSEIADSYPMPHPSLLRGSPSKLLESYLRSSTSKADEKTFSSMPQPHKRPASQMVSHIEVPSSPIQDVVEVASSQPEPKHLPAIQSSPGLPPQRGGSISASSDGEELVDGHVVPTSDEAPDTTNIASSPMLNGQSARSRGNTTPQSMSEDLLDVTHITGSPTEIGPTEVIGQEPRGISAQASKPGDPLNVSHVTNSFAENASMVAHSPTHEGPDSPKPQDDITHISMSSVDDSQGAVPSQTRQPPLAAGESLDVTHISSSSFEISEPRPNVEPLPPAKRRWRHSEDSSPSPLMSAPTTEFVPADTVTLSTDPQSVPPSACEIMPPSPPASCHMVSPEDLIPAQLSKLASDLSSCYRPSPTLRDLDPFERGYWFLDCGSWPEAARDSTWSFLQRYVRSGLAGWGLWCRRQELPHRFIRVYCWGHVVKHAYLLLYLASERRLKTTAAVWFDAEGKEVVKVSPYTERGIGRDREGPEPER
ncbi:hypothetical protein NLU13_9256 [Sarocladium strictum]|uniref:Uncharacterized protein n=1 Tax=Sarocladium strictum TaxID=5046 RepID=A0AA39L407_SARSR|nr:hypothetical protein NLU13_9256 [Sarocladium strictum]